MDNSVNNFGLSRTMDKDNGANDFGMGVNNNNANNSGTGINSAISDAIYKNP